MSSNNYPGFTRSGTPYNTRTTRSQAQNFKNDQVGNQGRGYNTAQTNQGSTPTQESGAGSNYGYSQSTSYNNYDSLTTPSAQKQVQQDHSNFNAAGSFPQQTNTNNNLKKKAGQPKPKQSPQMLYCDICQVSCDGPQPFKEHLEGQKHKKKEMANKVATAPPPALAEAPKSSLPPNSIRCEICDVTCTGGAEVYNSHIRGAKHQKKLHAHLGKPIPSSAPMAVTAPPPKPKKAVVNIPKIQPTGPPQLQEQGQADDGQPVGQEFIEQVLLDGKTLAFKCSLCDCHFNDPNSKELHMRGKKHRLQYKKKMDSVFGAQPNKRQKIKEEKQKKLKMKEEFWKKRAEDLSAMNEEERLYWEERRQCEEEVEYLEWYRRYGQDPASIHLPPRTWRGSADGLTTPLMVMRRPSTQDDKHVSAKHTQIYPSNEELQAIQRIVSNTEKALKLVSDEFAEADGSRMVVEPTEGMENSSPEGGNYRALKGVMRVGVLAKGLLLRGDLHVQLVVLCSEKPTVTLLNRLTASLPKQFARLTAERYEIKKWVDRAAIVVAATDSFKVTVTLTLTSTLLREQEGQIIDRAKEPRDLLDKQKCLEALAALRHAKWFQAKAAGLQSCVMIIRILRDLCQRISTWTPLSSWAMELLAEKVISSAGQPLFPGDALRRILEAVSSGLLLPGGPGLADPCEKDLVDAAAAMTNQQREDITGSAQHALRLVALKQVHKVLGMEVLPATSKQLWSRFNRKRRRDQNEQGNDGKKDKKEGE